MRRLARDWRIWTGVVAAVFVATFLATPPALANSLLKSLTALVLGDGTDGQSITQQVPPIPSVVVAGPGAAGGVQLVDMTAQYEKTDLVIETSIGSFAFTRVFRTNPTTYEIRPLDANYFVRPQWRWKGLTGYAWYDSFNGGTSCVPFPCDRLGQPTTGLPQCTSCGRHADFVVEDPDTGALLTYYSSAYTDGGALNGNAIPVTGFQIPADNQNSAKLYIVANGKSVTEFVLLKENVHYYFTSGNNPTYLTRVEDSQYRTIATLNYVGSPPGEISSVTTADGAGVYFHYTSTQLSSISLESTTIANYGTYADGGFSSVTYPETGAGEIYDGGNGGPYSASFSVTSLTGRQIISYAVDAGPFGSGPNGTGGNGAVSSQQTEDATLSLQGWYDTGAAEDCSAASSPWCTNPRTITDSSATSGDGTLSAATLTTVYTLAHHFSDPQTSGVSYSYPSGADAGWQYIEGLQVTGTLIGEDVPKLPIAEWSSNQNGFFTTYPDAGYSTSSAVPANSWFMRPVEYPTVVKGAMDALGTKPVITQHNTYAYGGVSQPVQDYKQFVQTTQQASPLGGNLTTYANWDLTNNRITSLVRTGTTAGFPYSLQQVSIGTFYLYATGAPQGRIAAALGPCLISGTPQQPSGCQSALGNPEIRYTYYGTGSPYANKLETRTVVLNNSTGTGLTTTYNAYDSRGRVTQSTDPNGTATYYTYSGDQLQSKLVGTDLTTYGYDGDQLLWVRQPSGMYDVTCHRFNTSDPSCATGGVPSKFVQWRARCPSNNCSSFSAKVTYFYAHGFVSRETYYDASNQIRRVVVHDRDPRNQPTYDAVGDAVYNPNATTAAFDGEGNETAIGFSYDGPAPFCNSGTSTTCAVLSYNGLNQISQLTEPLIAPAGQTQTTVLYDSLGHVSSIKYDDQLVTYQFDDFGNLITINAPWLSSAIQYTYDAAGHILTKVTPSMAAGEYLAYQYDTAGRVLNLQDYQDVTGSTVLWSLIYDSWNVPGSDCGSGTLTNGRVAGRVDSFGTTFYSYNFRGQVIGESRVRNGDGWYCAPFLTALPSCTVVTSEVNPNTSYFYTPGGILGLIQYPHGRVVEFGYGSDGDLERVSSVGVGLNVNGSCARTTLLSNVTWEPYGGLRGYQINAPPNISSATASVEYLLGGNSSSPSMTTCPAAARPSASNSDQTGRPRALWVSTGAYSPYSPTGTGGIFSREYSWQGDQLTYQETCLLQASGATATESYTYDRKLELSQASRPTGQRVITGGAWGQRAYGYDLRGNRGAGGTSDQTDCWGWTDTYSNDQLMNRAVTSNTCTGTALPYLSTSYGYANGGSDGRVTSMTSPPDSVGPSLTLTFDTGINGQAAVDSVYRNIQVNGGTYEYYYDANGQRRLKTYPSGDQDEFFYDTNGQMLEEHDEHGTDAPPIYSLDQYVWLDGRPVILLRSSASSTGTPNPDFTGTCADLGACGVFFPVTDYLRKPVLLLDSSLLVAGAADYDPFGQVNRVMGAGDTPHPYSASPVNSSGSPEAQVIAGFRQAVQAGASYNVIARARLAMVDTDAAATAYASLTDLKVNTLTAYPTGSGSVKTVGGPHSGAQVTGWAFVPPNGGSAPAGQFQVRFTAATGSGRPGVAVAGYEYRKYQSGSTPTWLPLRFPGQYYDPETDLVQNSNRFYDPQTGRYLAPEPLWRNPQKLVARLRSKGTTTPFYAYANNNALINTDPTGRDTLGGGLDFKVQLYFGIDISFQLQTDSLGNIGLSTTFTFSAGPEVAFDFSAVGTYSNAPDIDSLNGPSFGFGASSLVVGATGSVGAYGNVQTNDCRNVCSNDMVVVSEGSPLISVGTVRGVGGGLDLGFSPSASFTFASPLPFVTYQPFNIASYYPQQ